MRLSYTPKLYECTCCGKMKPETEFYRESYTDKRTNQCRQCINIKRRVQRDKSKHGKFISKEKIRGMETPDYVLDDWRDAMLHFGAACAFCGKPEGRGRKDKMDRDHVVAISKGGKTTRMNILPACRKCNRGRGNREWREWFRERDFWTLARERLVDAWVNQVGGANERV